MLSKKFLIEKFKNSHFRMNTFTVPAAFRGWKIPYEFTEDLQVDSIEETEVFVVSKSLFKNTQMPTARRINNMFEKDFGYSKIARFVKDKAELNLVKETIRPYYDKI